MDGQEGEGWRLAVDPSRRPFSVLIGGQGWAAELTGAEALALRAGVLRLRQQHAALVDGLMAEEALTLELEVPLEQGDLWLELEGDRNRWSLRFVLSPGGDQRALEGAWSVGAAAALAEALEDFTAPDPQPG